jgi:transposase
VKEQEVKTRFWKTVWHFFQSNPTLFFEHYYQRENVEAVFAAIKKKLGETLSSKDPVSQRNELLCKIIS